MAKVSNPAALPKAINATVFEIGNCVIVNNSATGNEDAKGRIVAQAKGWSNVELEDGRIVSARGGSLRLWIKEPVVEAAPAKGEDDDSDLQDDLDPNPEDLAEAEGATAHASRMAAALAEARKGYVSVRRPNGRATSHSGDALAQALQDLDPIQVAQLAAVVLGLPTNELADRYSSLNPGQIRMNSGNRIRAAQRRAEDTRVNSEDPAELSEAAAMADRIRAVIERPLDVLALVAEAGPGAMVGNDAIDALETEE